MQLGVIYEFQHFFISWIAMKASSGGWDTFWVIFLGIMTLIGFGLTMYEISIIVDSGKDVFNLILAFIFTFFVWWAILKFFSYLNTWEIFQTYVFYTIALHTMRGLYRIPEETVRLILNN